MILSSPRSGTHMLRSSLDSHPNAVCLTEMFNPDYTGSLYPLTEQSSEHEILNRYIFHDYSPEVLAVGFCLHRLDARFGNWPDLWNILASMEDLSIISLRRENLLRRFWSFELRSVKDPELRNQPFVPRLLNKDRLIADFERQTNIVETFDNRFSAHPLLTVSYEELCNSYEQTMRRVQQFVGLPLVNLKPGTGRRPTPRVSEKVSNYEELKREFAGTRWERFFDD